MTTPEVRSQHVSLRRLAATGLPGPFVTLLVPPVRGTAGRRSIDEIGDRLVRDATLTLQSPPWSISAKSAVDLLRPALEQLNDVERLETAGLAVVVAPDLIESIVITGDVEPDHIVAARPDLVVLSEAIARSIEFHLLVLSQHRVELYRCTDTESVRVDADLPTGVDDLVWHERRRTHSVDHTGPSAVDERHAAVGRFVASVDRALPRDVHDGDLPLVVAAVAFEAAMLRDTRSHRDLVLLTELGSPEHHSIGELHAAAVRRLEPRVAAEHAALVDRYRTRAGAGVTASGLEAIASLAAEGRVDTLLVDAEGRRASTTESRARLAVVAADVIAHGGTVRAILGDRPQTRLDDLAVALLRF